MHDPRSAPAAIAQVAVNASDIDRATAFYRDVVGLPFLFAAPGMAFFDCGGVRVMLSEPSDERFDHPASILYYTVEDIDAAHERMVSAGARSERGPHKVHEGEGFELWMAFLHDSEGNVFALASQRNSD